MTQYCPTPPLLPQILLDTKSVITFLMWRFKPWVTEGLTIVIVDCSTLE